MRVVMCGTELAPLRHGAGGLENVVCTWADELAGRFGDDVHLVSLDPTRTAGAGDRTRTRGAAAGGGPTVHDVAGPDVLVALVERLAPDVVQLNNRPGLAGRLLGRAPVLVTLHNHLDALDVDEVTGREATAWSAVSAYLAGYYRSAGVGTEIAVTRPGVEPDLVVDEPRPAAGRTVDVLVAGRLLRKKGMGRVPAIAAHPHLAGLGVVVTRFLSPWAEATDEHRALEAELAAVPNVELIEPPTSRVAYRDLLASARVVLLPAAWDEPFGMVSIEAQVAGTRVVGSARGGLPETIGAPSVTVGFDDLDAVAAAIGAAVADPVPSAEDHRRIVDRFGSARSASILRESLVRAVHR